jgi:hypothetical protein
MASATIPRLTRIRRIFQGCSPHLTEATVPLEPYWLFAVSAAEMKRPWFFGFLIALVIFAVIEHDPIVRQWIGMYPSDRHQRTALALCYTEDHQFNRANAAARAACYEKWLPILSYMAQHNPSGDR